MLCLSTFCWRLLYCGLAGCGHANCFWHIAGDGHLFVKQCPMRGPFQYLQHRPSINKEGKDWKVPAPDHFLKGSLGQEQAHHAFTDRLRIYSRKIAPYFESGIHCEATISQYWNPSSNDLILVCPPQLSLPKKGCEVNSTTVCAFSIRRCQEHVLMSKSFSGVARVFDECGYADKTPCECTISRDVQPPACASTGDGLQV